MKCKDCRFWETTDSDEQEGECHRGFPRVLIDSRRSDGLRECYLATWPMTGCLDWCGDFEPHEGPEPDAIVSEAAEEVGRAALAAAAAAREARAAEEMAEAAGDEWASLAKAERTARAVAIRRATEADAAAKAAEAQGYPADAIWAQSEALKAASAAAAGADADDEPSK